jgi:hypothetical protein
VTFARLEQRFGRALLFKRARSPQGHGFVAVRVRRLSRWQKREAANSARPETGAIVLFISLFFLFSGPVIRLFSARAFSFAISMTFPVFGAHRRPVNRLYFFNGLFHAHGLDRATGCFAPHRGCVAAKSTVLPGISGRIGFVRRESERG